MKFQEREPKWRYKFVIRNSFTMFWVSVWKELKNEGGYASSYQVRLYRGMRLIKTHDLSTVPLESEMDRIKRSMLESAKNQLVTEAEMRARIDKYKRGG